MIIKRMQHFTNAGQHCCVLENSLLKSKVSMVTNEITPIFKKKHVSIQIIVYLKKVVHDLGLDRSNDRGTIAWSCD